MNLLIFGFGYSGAALARRLIAQGWNVAGVARSQASQDAMESEGVTPISPDAPDAAVAVAHAVLVAAPPDAEGCPGLRVLGPALARAGSRPDWIGYLSTTGVYGDRGGGWVFEDSALKPLSVEGARRAEAERGWLELGRDGGMTVTVFRLPGIYGPSWRGQGRSPLDRTRKGGGPAVDKPGQVFSRIHVEDLAAGLQASMRRPRPGGIYNLCDDAPAAPAAVAACAAALLGLPPPVSTPFDAAALSPAQRRFYAESKRVSNALAKAELGWRPTLTDYRAGLNALLAAEA